MGLLLLVAFSGCSGSDDGKKSSNPTGSDSPTSAECTEASAQAVDRAQISKAKVEPACVKLKKGASFTLLNADARRHSFATSPSSPVELQVDLKQGSAFPYRYNKPGTYTFKEASTDLTFTVLVS